jgi:hypothetical protein
MSKLEMTPQKIMEMRNDFIAERIAIMMVDGGLPERVAIVEAEECWNKYLRHVKRAGQYQEPLETLRIKDIF